MPIPLTSRITAFPVRHGKAAFAMELRNLLWTEKFDAFAFAWPTSLLPDAQEAVEALPAIHSLVIRRDGEVKAYLPMDPCDAYIEALRQSGQRRIPCHFLEDDELIEAPLHQPLPDAYLLRGIGMSAYYAMAKDVLGNAEPSALDPQGTILKARGRRCMAGLRNLEKKHTRILFLCDFPVLFRLEELLAEDSISGMLAEVEYKVASDDQIRLASRGGATADDGVKKSIRGRDSQGRVEARIYPVRPALLYFALGEFPFYAGEMEKERADPMAQPMEYLDLIKRIFVETRNQFLTDPNEVGAISIKKIQSALIYLRNLAVLKGRLTPDLIDVVAAAKGVFGNAFAAKVLESGKYYPFFDPLLADDQMLEIGREQIAEPSEEGPATAFNMLEDEPKIWRTLHIKREPNREQQRRYRYAWDARGMCSHTPEDDRIEGFNRAVRRRSRDIDVQAFARTEKLTTSLKDGIDMRETLRHWSTGEIHVRENPPARGQADTVVIIFDSDHDERYPSHTTWYAEHEEESTLTFYATDPMAKLIGPGISESEYGGLSLLFPPRHVENIFDLPAEEYDFRNLAEQLVYGALLNTRERTVAYVSQTKPGLRLRRMAARFKKRLIWVPMAGFSAETLRRLRKFHILNGKEVRAWASRYIPD